MKMTERRSFTAKGSSKMKTVAGMVYGSRERTNIYISIYI